MTVKENEPTCRICRLTFNSESPEDRKRHIKDHLQLANGSMPFGVLEFLKGFGWKAAYQDKGWGDRLIYNDSRNLSRIFS